jgi:DNA-binding XRE family transcriptional regulator
MDKEALQKRLFLEEFGQNLEKLIYRKFKTKGEFLSETGMFKQTLHDIVKGKADPQLTTLRTIAEGLGVPVRDLFPFK